MLFAYAKSSVLGTLDNLVTFGLAALRPNDSLSGTVHLPATPRANDCPETPHKPPFRLRQLPYSTRSQVDHPCQAQNPEKIIALNHVRSSPQLKKRNFPLPHRLW